MEKDILERLKLGDEQAYKFIFDEYYAPLTAFANKYLRDLDVSKEISQNAFVKIFEKRESIEISKNFKAYLYQIVYNDCISYIRNQKRKESHIDEIKNLYEHSVDYEQLVHQTEEEYKLYQLIEQLPPQCKAIFKLSRFENRKNSEIAEELKISIRTVETQISKAIKYLKSNYKTLLFTIFNF